MLDVVNTSRGQIRGVSGDALNVGFTPNQELILSHSHTHNTKQNKQTSKYKLASDVLFKYEGRVNVLS